MENSIDLTNEWLMEMAAEVRKDIARIIDKTTSEGCEGIDGRVECAVFKALQQVREQTKEKAAKMAENSAKPIPGPPGNYEFTMTPLEIATAIRQME